tara:strand:- start:201 stop:383 length:183 start_codon:yes stop_codon:yes gene_type:complete
MSSPGSLPQVDQKSTHYSAAFCPIYKAKAPWKRSTKKALLSLKLTHDFAQYCRLCDNNIR